MPCHSAVNTGSCVIWWRHHAHLILIVSAPMGDIVTTLRRVGVTFLMRLRRGMVERDGTWWTIADVSVVHDCMFGLLTWL